MFTPDLIAELAPMASSGIFDLLNEKLGDLRSLILVAAVVAGSGFVLWQAITSRGNLARIVVSGIGAAVLIYLVYNVTDLKDRVGNEIDNNTTTQVPNQTP